MVLIRITLKFSEIMITGGAGFIGSNLVRELLPISEKIIIIDDLSTGKLSNIKSFQPHEKIFFHKCDISDYNKLKDIFEKYSVQYISHHAAIASVPKSFDDPISSNKVNVSGTLNLLDLAKKYCVKKLVFASSCAIYGNTTELPINENTNSKPLSPYAAGKLACEYYAKVYNDSNLLKTSILRYFNIFGPYQNAESQYSAVMPLFIKLSLLDKPITINGDGKQTRDFTYVKNVCQANIKAFLSKEANGKIMNIGSGKAISINDLAKKIIEKTNSSSKIIYGPNKLGDIKDSIADINYAKRCLKYKLEVTFDEGLERTIGYYKDYIL